MNTPFPGMDPHLEHPRRWQGVHNSLIADMQKAIAPTVAPNYYVTTESHAYIVQADHGELLGKPDVAIISPIGVLPTSTHVQADAVDVLEVTLPMREELTDYYLEIREVGTDTLVTTIELLSPANKVDKDGRSAYIRKRDNVLQSLTNFVEIDLLRVGKPMPPANVVSKSDYRILVSRSWERPTAQLIAFNLRTAIPDFRLPLLPDDEEPILKLNDILHRLYWEARYDLRIDYAQQPVPPLSDDDWTWAQSLVAAT